MVESGYASSLTTEERALLADHMTDPVIVVAPDGTIEYLNPAALELELFRNATEEQLNAQTLWRYALENFEISTVEGTQVRGDELPLVDALSRDQFEMLELLVRRHDQDLPRMLSISGKTIAQNRRLLIATARDETQRWRAEQRYQAMFDTDPAPTLVARLASGRILQANAGMADLTGHARGELETMTIEDLDLFAGNPVLDHALSALRDGTSLHKVRTRLTTANGQDIDVLFSARSIELGGHGSAVLTFIDISALEESRRAERELAVELAEARKRLAAQRERERSDIARDLHDGVLQELLALAAHLGSQMGLPEVGDAEHVAHVLEDTRSAVLKAAKNLRSTVRDARPPNLAWGDLWDALEQAFQHAVENGGPDLVLRQQPSPTDLDEDELYCLYRVAQEAIRNAMKHANPSQITVEYAQVADEATLTVTDDGDGFDVPDRRALRNDADHFGLVGMWERTIARGGTLTVESTKGQGTTVTCTIPVSDEPLATTANSEPGRT